MNIDRGSPTAKPLFHVEDMDPRNTDFDQLGQPTFTFRVLLERGSQVDRIHMMIVSTDLNKSVKDCKPKEGNLGHPKCSHKCKADTSSRGIANPRWNVHRSRKVNQSVVLEASHGTGGEGRLVPYPNEVYMLLWRGWPAGSVTGANRRHNTS